MITTTGLTKSFGSVRAVDDVALEVQAGDIYGFLGANGSGKTTTVRMLLGLVLPTSGRIELLGHAMPKAAKRVLPDVGALVEGPAAYGHLSGRSNLMLIDASGSSRARGAAGIARSKRGSRVDAALARVGLDRIGNRPVKAYSLGMRQRLGLAAALLRSPTLLVLDEPTNGLDPQGIREVRDLLLELHDQGTTVFLSSHLLAEVEQLCTRVGVLDRGRLVLQDDLATLREPTGCTLVCTPDAAAAVEYLGSAVEHRDGERLTVRDPDPGALNARLVGRGLRVTELLAQRHSLEQVVLAATGPSLDRA